MATQYPQRSDLRNPMKKLAATAVPGQTYGAAGAQLAAQKAVPMAAPNAPQAPQPNPNAVPPGGHGPFDRGTERPLEPVTAGNPLGAGPGPEVISQRYPAGFEPGGKIHMADQLRYLYSRYPNRALLDLIYQVENTAS
jgi:hypothetical protein